MRAQVGAVAQEPAIHANAAHLESALGREKRGRLLRGHAQGAVEADDFAVEHPIADDVLG